MIRRTHLLRRAIAPLLTALSLGWLAGAGSVQSSMLQHERLRVRNTFRTPEEVVSYYCARDASGFVWSGLLDAERRAFTNWMEAPQVDSFYIAKSYRVHPSEKIGHDPNQATVEVSYDLLGVGDAHGTRAPASVNPYTVVFDLKKIGGAWKIVKPEPERIAPVVLEAKFPYAKGQE